jgi:RNA polymerase sigma-70 factor (ECF subfamily)
MFNLKTLSDDSLIAQFVSGNNSAFDVLLERHQKRVYNYILHLVKDADTADDIFQETYVKIIMTIKQGRYYADGKFA